MDTIDRIAPTLEPADPLVMYQNWHHLLFLHWEVPAAELQARLPAGLELDTFEGHAYVGLVPFTVSGVRPVLLPPVPGLSSFHEINVRTYVHVGGKDPGVWFFSLDASSRVAVEAARSLYKLDYFDADIEFGASDDPLPRVDVRCRRTDPRGAMPAGCSISYTPADAVVSNATPGTLDHFLLERYILYAADDSRNLYRARIHHQPYPLQRVDVRIAEETLVWAAGIRRSEEPHLRHYAREVNVKVYPLTKI